MDALYDSAKQFAELLKQSRLPAVQDWKEQDLMRAFKWVDYFRKVHIQLSQKNKTVQQLNVKFREIGHSLGSMFGGEELSYDFMPHSSDYLIRVLLENPSFSENLRELIVKQGRVDASFVQNYMHKVSELSVLVHSLSEMSSMFPKSMTSVDASFLCKHIDWLLKMNDFEAVRKTLKDVVELDGGMEVVLLALLPQNIPLDDKQLVQDAVLEWIMDEEDMGIWKEDVCILAQVSFHHIEMFEKHLDHLSGMVDNLEEKSIFCEEKTYQYEGKDFEFILSHFKALLECGGSVKNACTALIASKSCSPTDDYLFPSAEDKKMNFELLTFWGRLAVVLNVIM